MSSAIRPCGGRWRSSTPAGEVVRGTPHPRTRAEGSVDLTGWTLTRESGTHARGGIVFWSFLRYFASKRHPRARRDRRRRSHTHARERHPRARRDRGAWRYGRDTRAWGDPPFPSAVTPAARTGHTRVGGSAGGRGCGRSGTVKGAGGSRTHRGEVAGGLARVQGGHSPRRKPLALDAGQPVGNGRTEG